MPRSKPRDALAVDFDAPKHLSKYDSVACSRADHDSEDAFAPQDLVVTVCDITPL